MMPIEPTNKAMPQDLYALVNRVASNEGWALMTIGIAHGEGYRIERDDETGVFKDDDAAIKFVERLALGGSMTHQLALAAHADFDDYRELLPLSESGIHDIEQIAMSEGWLFDRYDNGEGAKFQITMHENSNVFRSYEETYAFVKLKAAAGSLQHRMAIAAHRKGEGVVTGMVTVKAEAKISITYLLPAGMPTSELHRLLDDNLSHFIGGGGLTGDTEATADSHDVTIKMDI